MCSAREHNSAVRVSHLINGHREMYPPNELNVSLNFAQKMFSDVAVMFSQLVVKRVETFSLNITRLSPEIFYPLWGGGGGT